MSNRRSRGRRLAVACAVAVSLAGARTAAQTLPSAPIVVADGHVTLGGDASVTVGPDDDGYFNYTDYDHSTFRLLRLDLTGSVRATDHLTFLGDIRSENGDAPTPYAFYVRVRPWTSRNIDIEAGRIPPAFGSFPRRSYASDNLLIGYPLAYQYITSLRADALPANADDLLRMRARGWLANYPVGNRTAQHGLPLADAFHWDTGVQVHAAGDVVDATFAVTTGTLSNPLFGDDNSGRQFAGRVAFHPVAGLIVGASAARGPFVTSAAARAASAEGDANSLVQEALGADVEYSRGYYLVRSELIYSQWTLPRISAPFITAPLGALSGYVEGRYKVQPGLYFAGRVDHLGFSDITGTAGTRPWEAPVTRVEVGGGYSIQRNLILKASLQHNTREGGLVPRKNLVGVQLLFWF